MLFKKSCENVSNIEGFEKKLSFSKRVARKNSLLQFLKKVVLFIKSCENVSNIEDFEKKLSFSKRVARKNALLQFLKKSCAFY